MRAILVRTGIDQRYGGWNAPVDPGSGEFVYVPIPEKPDTVFHGGLGRGYHEVLPHLASFAARHGLEGEAGFPPRLIEQATHLDPDFEALTYGDHGARRGARLRGLGDGDLIVFYAGLRPVGPWADRLLYALVGLYVVREVVLAREVEPERWHENAHTRIVDPAADELVVRAHPDRSGRLESCLPMGEWRDRAYRLRRDLIEAWGGISVKDGYLQRSGVLPRLGDPQRFLRWWDRQSPTLRMANN